MPGFGMLQDTFDDGVDRDSGPDDIAEVDHLNITPRPAQLHAAARAETGPGPYARRGPTLQGG